MRRMPRVVLTTCALTLLCACDGGTSSTADTTTSDTAVADTRDAPDTTGSDTDVTPDTRSPADTEADTEADTGSGDTAEGDVDRDTDTSTGDVADTRSDATDTGDDGGGSSFEPYFYEDFESYTDGESLSGSPFGAAGRTTASSDQAYRGSTSARMAIKEGDGGGFGQWGGTVKISPAPGVGEEVWVRLAVWWPSSFEFSASPWMKFLRLHNRKGNGDNGGYNDLYVDNADSNSSVLRTIKEFHDQWAVYDGEPIPRDTWETYEMYLSIDDTSVDDGGDGRVRIWRDGELIFDRTDVPTVTGPDGVIDFFYLFTYWNNEDPPNNHCYVDDLVIATSDSPPPNTDDAGHRRIGDWTP